MTITCNIVEPLFFLIIALVRLLQRHRTNRTDRVYDKDLAGVTMEARESPICGGGRQGGFSAGEPQEC